MKNYEMKLHFTIVTVVFNDAVGLERTISSVINQTYKGIEFIIIDGGSSDGIIETIKKYEGDIDLFISEKDRGIYDAMNKGIKYSNGDFIIFMNAGDIFASDDVLYRVFNKITEKELAYFGRALMLGEKLTWTLPPQEMSDPLRIDAWSRKYLPIHQSIFFPRSFYICHHYDENFKITGDSEYKLRYLKTNKKFIFVDVEICHFSLGGISTKSDDLATAMCMFKEKINLVNLYYHGLDRIINKFLCITYFIKFGIRTMLGQERYQKVLYLLSRLRAYF
ncbi:glycosyltransferase family 2 protein [Sphaerospermopsis sp. FACHB-1194]|uniref:glycosyltransferase family 2 protein n=1 Tax=Sphaerospermopsis sp. FACHB-1194 TaxID=2692862 RepID=UPI001681B5FA|nr:glycosyltransferase family 2 protein [Sphaerospermopsis sp. FACHB-1194]MBD2148132.1 glycosyltransferase [Sphaerospermopsis sp. FACHB-1194]